METASACPCDKAKHPCFSFARQPVSRSHFFLPSAISLHQPSITHSSISLQQHGGIQRWSEEVLIMRLSWPWRRKTQLAAAPPPHGDDVPVAVGTHLHVGAGDDGDDADAESTAASLESERSHLTTLPVEEPGHVDEDAGRNGVRHTHYEVDGSGSEEGEGCSESDTDDQSAEANVDGRHRRRRPRHHRRGGRRRRRRPAGGVPALMVVAPAAAVMLLALVALVTWKRRQRRML
ncbi:uncharacterized protein [Setaria viridis]